MTGLFAAALAGYGVFLVVTAVGYGWTGVGPGPRPTTRRRRTLEDWLRQAGLDGVRPVEFAAAVVVLGVLGGALAYALFGGVLPALVTAAFAATFPLASYRARRARRLATAREAWPRMLEELRLLTGALGRSIPTAVVEVGHRAPPELAGAFRAAEREWLLSTDFPRTMAVLKARLADPTADVVCETLELAHEVGGSGIEQRLADLAEDRIADLQGRKDARAKQAAVVFARRFVLLVPLGMALAGLSIGTGRSAYESPAGQLAVVAGVLAVIACWAWSGRLMRIPEEPRVFGGVPGSRTPAPQGVTPAQRGSTGVVGRLAATRSRSGGRA